MSYARLRGVLCGSVLALGLVSSDRPADACGGCFRPSQVVSVVNAHRMVFSVSQSQTILWDQFNYTGNPSDFAWVLPVHATSVKVELAHDEFISALDAWTSPVINGPQAKSSGGFGCGSNSLSYAPGDNGGGVQVINQQVVGPYEVATLRSTDPSALETWLTDHGYEIAPSVQPVIAAYVGDGFDFIALRLQPGQGVAAMQPVRVVSAGADPTLPLRMVAAGVGSDVNILLYVISEGRYESSNFNNTEVDFSKLEWNKTTTSSNYNTLIQDAMTSGDGRNFTVEFAGHMYASDGFSTFPHSPFSNVYSQGVFSSAACPYVSVHGADFADAGTVPPFGDGGTSDSGTDDAGTGDAGTGDAGTLAQPYDSCFFDDLTTATQGMNHDDIFVTRLRADLKTSALSQDLVVRAASNQSAYDNVHNATQTGDGCQVTDTTAPTRDVVLFALASLAVLFAVRRKRA